MVALCIQKGKMFLNVDRLTEQACAKGLVKSTLKSHKTEREKA